MKVPLLDLAPQNNPLHAQIMAAIEGVAKSQRFIMGPEVDALEKEIAAYSGAQFGIGVSSGTDALLVSLMALGVKPGDEVITSPYTFFATAGAIARLGAKAVFVDIDPITYNIDPAQVEKAITDKTKVIIPVHLYGQVADLEPILNIARKKNIAVLEDAAQSIGAQYRNGKRAGAMGDLGCFSFFPSKNLGAFGDGGMVITNNEELANKVRILRVHGGKPKYYHKIVGGNFRLDPLQAAVIRVKLKHLDAWTLARQKNAQLYDKLFADHSLQKQIKTPHALYDKSLSHYHIYNQYIIESNDRDALRVFLQEKEIGTEIYYPLPLHIQECFKSWGYSAGAFPHAEKAAKASLALPIYPGLKPDQQQWVVEAVSQFLKIPSKVSS